MPKYEIYALNHNRDDDYYHLSDMLEDGGDDTYDKALIRAGGTLNYNGGIVVIKCDGKISTVIHHDGFDGDLNLFNSVDEANEYFAKRYKNDVKIVD